jgi:hypothetical protein
MKNFKLNGQVISTWKQFIKDSKLNVFNIFIEPVDNGIDAGATNIDVEFQTNNKHTLTNLRVIDDGRGMSDDVVRNNALAFPITTFDYLLGSIGANGYGLKGSTMRIGFFKHIITKTSDEDTWRVYNFSLIDKDGKIHQPENVLQYHKPSHGKFINYTYMREDIVEFNVEVTTLTREKVEELTNKDFAQYSSGTFIEIIGMEDNEIRLKANEFQTVKESASFFYGQMDFKLRFKFNDEPSELVKPMKFPVEGWPTQFTELNEFPKIVVDNSGNEYDAYYFFTLSEKHQRQMLEDYESYVSEDRRWKILQDGVRQRNDGQYIVVFDNNRRGVGSFRFNGNNTFYGNFHNNMNIVLVARDKIKNLDRYKFLGFADNYEVDCLRDKVKSILNKDVSSGTKEYVNPNWEADKQDEISQTRLLVNNIIDNIDKYRSRFIEFIADKVESVRINTQMIKDESNWVVTNGNRYGNQIDIDSNDMKLLWEIENEDSASSKDHLEKINLWYDEIIQQNNDDIEWIIWVAKSHSFEKRLKNLLKNKPCTNSSFKGFILVRWKDFRVDESVVNIKYVLTENK